MINFALEGPKWTASVVTWSFAAAGNPSFTNAVAPAYQAAIRAAAAQWGAVANLTLREAAPGSAADITVGWGSFAGTQIGQTDYSYRLGTPNAFVAGMTIHIEDPALLPLGTGAGATYQGTATTLQQVALHEFGHALGLGLSADPTSVMNLRLGPGNTTIGASDLGGIAALYGSKAGVGIAAASVAGPDTVPLSGDSIGIYRFFDSQHGTQFLTGSLGEMNTIFSTRPDLKFEGLAMAGIGTGTSDPNAVPVRRFFDTSSGTHFFTASAVEAATVAATRPDLIGEGISFDEHLTAEAGDVPVYRFFNSGTGTHFFTADETERGSLVATRPDMVLEGVAIYAPADG